MRGSFQYGAGRFGVQVIDRPTPASSTSHLLNPIVWPSGTAITSQRAQTVAASGLLIFTGTEAKPQATQTVAAAGKEIFTGTENRAQAAQSEADSGKLIFTGSSSTSQLGQSSVVSGGEVFGGTETGAQTAQTDSAAGKEIFTGSGSTQQAQSTSSLGQETLVGGGSTAQAPQSATGFESFSGTSSNSSIAQTMLAGGFTPIVANETVFIGGGRRPFGRTSLDLKNYLPTTIFGQSWSGGPKQDVAASGKIVLPPRMSGEYRTFQRKQKMTAYATMLDQELEAMTWLWMNV